MVFCFMLPSDDTNKSAGIKRQASKRSEEHCHGACHPETYVDKSHVPVKKLSTSSAACETCSTTAVKNNVSRIA